MSTDIVRSSSFPKISKYPCIISLGSSLNLKMVLSLEEKQYESLGINFKEIKKTEDLQKLYPPPLPYGSPIHLQKLTSLIELHSTNFLLNSIFFINHSSPRKLPIKYLIPFSPKFPNELNFIYNIIKSITEVNHIYIEDYNLLDIKPKIIFNLKLIKNDIIIEEKSFVVCNENHFESKNKDNSEENKNEENYNINKFYNGDLFKGLNFDFYCDFFYSSIKELYFCKKENCNEIIDFLNKIKIKCPKMKICTNFEEDFVLNEDATFINNLIELTDIFIFEKKNIFDFYDKIINNKENTEEKNILGENNKVSEEKTIENFFIYKIKQQREKDKDKEKALMKLGIFLNNLEEIILIEQNPKTNLVINKINKKINIIPPSAREDDVNDYLNIIKNKYSPIKSVYIGSFLNTLFKNEKLANFNMCFKSGEKCTMRFLEILKFGLDVPSVQKYYEIKIPKPIKKKINKEEIKNKQLESKFILDCTNLNNNKIATYNSILDENCRNFFNSKITLKHLYKQGFINKRGLLIDPEKKNEILGFVQNAHGKNKLIKKIKTLNELNMGHKQVFDLKKNTALNQMNFKNLYKKDFDSFNETNKSRQNLTNHRIILPKIKCRTSQINGRNEEKKKEFNTTKK